MCFAFYKHMGYVMPMCLSFYKYMGYVRAHVLILPQRRAANCYTTDTHLQLSHRSRCT